MEQKTVETLQNLKRQASHNTKNVIIVLLLLALLATGAILIFQPKGISIKDYNALNDSLHSSRDELGRQTVMTKAIQFENEKAFLRLQSNDSTIRWLQQTIRSFDGKIQSAIVAALVTTNKGSTKTEVIPGDTIRSGDTLKLYPTYKAVWSNKWEIGSIRATKDSVYRDIKTINEFELTIGKPARKFKNLFREPDLECTLKNNNPNTVTKELKSFTVKVPQKRFGIGFSAGVHINADLKVRPYVGLGINYNIIEFNLRGRQK